MLLKDLGLLNETSLTTSDSGEMLRDDVSMDFRTAVLLKPFTKSLMNDCFVSQTVNYETVRFSQVTGVSTQGASQDGGCRLGLMSQDNENLHPAIPSPNFVRKFYFFAFPTLKFRLGLGKTDVRILAGGIERLTSRRQTKIPSPRSLP
jgi:hypothetical protein